MFDADQTASDLTSLLLSSDRLLNVNIKKYRTLRLSNMVDFFSLVTTPRAGRFGAAVVVLEPYARSRQKNVLVFDWVFPVVSIECPQINENINGSQLTAYELAQIVADEGHNYADENVGTFNVDDTAIEDEPQFKLEGCVEKRTNFHILGKNSQTARTGQIQHSNVAGLITLTCSNDPSAVIWYTVDGSFPGNQNGGSPSSQIYTGPFTTNSGSVVRARAYAAGKIGSATAIEIIL